MCSDDRSRWWQRIGHVAWGAVSAGLTFGLLAVGEALALGLGEAQGEVMLGTPLALRIPLTGAGPLPAPECIALLSAREADAAEHRWRTLSWRLTGSPGQAFIAVSSQVAVNQPVIAFRLRLACGIGVERDYLLLPAMPRFTPAADERPPHPAAAISSPAAERFAVDR